METKVLDSTTVLTFALVALGMVLTPGPNMVYLLSRSICQGRAAGFVSLLGVGMGFAFYALCAALGLTAVVLAVPFAYDAVRLAGVLYLLWLAWRAIRPGGVGAITVTYLTFDSSRRLFLMGFLTNVTNPKIAVMYLSLLPQFIDPSAGSVMLQSLVLSGIQIGVSVSVNALIIALAGSVAAFVTRRPLIASAQRWLMGTVYGALAARLALETRS